MKPTTVPIAEAIERLADPSLRILHFNDVYNICASSQEPVGGLSRFQSRVKHYRSHKDYAGQPDLLTLFSGDAINPSLESIFTRGISSLMYPKCFNVLATHRHSIGQHMVEALNRIGVDAACIGVGLFVYRLLVLSIHTSHW